LTGLAASTIYYYRIAASNAAGTNQGGISSFTTLVTSVERLEGQLPETYFLAQNYPNPFNPSTTIEFALPKSTFVTLWVWDLLGRQVGELVNEKLSPGTYGTQWDAGGLAGGVYFYRLQAGDFVETKKMLLMR
jgi:hypothetical protein